MTAVLRQFEYEAVDLAGKRSKGKLEAVDTGSAAATLIAQGATPLTVVESGTGLKSDIKIPGLGGRLKLADLAVCVRQWATMTASGLPLIKTLTTLEEQTSSPKIVVALKAVRLEVEQGRSLSDALAKHDRVFPRIMISLVRAGETGGFLDEALDRIAINLEKDAHLRGKIKSALTYPGIVLAFSGVMITAVLVFIVPIFQGMFASLGGQLPLPTQILVTASHQIVWIGIGIIGGGISAVTFYKRKMLSSYDFRLKADTLKLKLPVFGNLFTKIAISRFSRNLSTLLSSGVPIMQALEIVGDTTGNAMVTEAMKDVQNSVRSGGTISAPLHDHPIFPTMLVQMMQVGEETGQISAMLEKVADFYDAEVEATADALTASIEPLMVVVMGAVVGSMVVCLYLPMFTIYQNIQN